MATIIRRPVSGPAFPALFAEFDPFRVVEGLFRVHPTADASLRHAEFAPSFDVKETKDAFLFKADLPGVKESDLEISHNGNRLSIVGKREAEERKEGENYFMFERHFGSFQRTFTLPESADVEQIKAELHAGVLSLQIPKRVAAQPRKITISTSEGKKD
ncbi:MAG: Hsp20/alpha crystallin family protein [Myxococcales bacterium]|nr:Hsp20/alpha crystallin family protein [Myxococcales bacterium]